MTKKERAWLDGIKMHGVSEGTGIEIVCRLVVKEEHGYRDIEEILEKCREYGAAEITQTVQL